MTRITGYENVGETLLRNCVGFVYDNRIVNIITV